MHYLYYPPEIIANIFSRLPVKSLLGCSCVCKQWYAIIYDSYFAKLHLTFALKHTKPYCSDFIVSTGNNLCLVEDTNEGLVISKKLDFHLNQDGPFNLRDTSSGLIFLEYGNDLRFICNPATGKQMNNDIDSHWHDNSLCLYASIAIGFCVSSQEYKMVQVSNREAWNLKECESKFEVITLSTLEKRRIGIYPFRIRSNPVLFNGAFHWIFINYDILEIQIVSFNLDYEEIEEIPIPKIKHSDIYKFYECHLGVLGGCLSLSDCSRDLNGIDIWVMKDYNVKDSWTKLYSAICIPVWLQWEIVYAKPLCYRKNGELLLMMFCANSSYLLSYDPESGNSRAVEIAGLDRYIYVSPNGKVKFEAFPFTLSPSGV